jgi:general secretion pathway protein D
LAELDLIEKIIQVLNMTPPQVTIEAKFAEVTQDDNRALGFDWTVGNFLMGGGRVVMQPGTAPSYVGQPSTANPTGIFPGPSGVAGVVPPSATDNRLSGGLRNTAPAIGTISGILTDPQFRLVISALEQRTGVDVISAPKITTLSSRQTEIKVVNLDYVVTGLDYSQTSAGGGGSSYVNAGSSGAAVASAIVPYAEPMEFGPVLDVVPYVCADGYTIQMTIIPTIREFVGYDFETAKNFVAQVQSVSGNGASSPLQISTPMPKFRLRQVVTSAIVWDHQTLMLGGLISENVQKQKDKVPGLGDIPLIGRLFRSESSLTQKKNLLIFVTPTIIDPAGNRLHTDEEMPFAQNSIPDQTLRAPTPTPSTVTP